MKLNTTTVAAVAVALLMAFAAFSGGALADPAVTSDSDITDDDVLYLDPSGDDVAELEFTVENDNTESVSVTIVANETDEQLVAMSDTDDDATVDGDTWTFNVSHSDLINESDHDVGDEYELDVTVEHEHDDNDDGTTETATTEISTDAVPVSTADQSTVLVSDATTDDLGVDVDVEDASEGLFGFGAEDFDTFDASNNHPHGDYDYNETTYVFDGDTADAYDDAAEDVDDGELILGMTVLVNGEVVPTYAEESGDFHEDGDAYAVYDAEESELTTYLGEDREDAFATDVRVVNTSPSDELRFGEARELFSFGVALDLIVPFDLP